MRKIIHRYTVLLLTVLLVGTGIALADTDVIVLGDVNSDGSVNTDDVTALVNYLHGSGAVNEVAADVNRDKAIDIADVTAINNIISKGTFDKGTASTLFFPAATVEKTYGDAAFKNQLVRSGSTGAITYTSSATGVATVNTTTGEVTIQGAGTAIITATLADNGGITGTYANYTLNVAQATNSLTTTPVLASTSQDFTGSPVTLVTTEGAALFGSVEYSTTSATEGFSTTVPTATDAGDYTVWYRVPGTASYTAIDAVKLGTVTISPATLSVTASDYSGAYDGTAHGITVTCEGATVKYGETEGTYNLDASPTLTDVGTKTVYYQVTKDNYTTVTGSQTVTITQKEVTVSGITAEDKTYNGNTTATLVYTGATITGKVESDDLTVTATGTFDDANVGTGKTVTISGITLGGSSAANYKLAESGNQTSTTADITAASFTPVVTLSGWTYGSPNDPSVGETNTSGGTVTYYYKTGDAEWTTTQPTDVGTHKVKASIAENGNYAAAESAEVEFTITQKALTITAKAQTISYGSSIAISIDKVTTDGLVGGDALTAVTLTPSTDQVTTSGTITPSAATTTKGIENYNVTYTAGNLTINKVAASVTTAPTGKTSLTYTGEAQELVDATSAAYTGGTLVYSKTENGTYGAASTITETNAGTYNFWYKVQGDGNHDDSTPVEITGVVIDKANPTYTAPSYSALTYTGGVQDLISAGSTEHGTFTYSTTQEGTYSETIPQGTASGNYTVWYKLTGDANHNDVAAIEVPGVSIGKKEVTVSGITAEDKTYNGNTTATLVYTGATITGKVESDELTVTATGTFDNANVGTDKTVTISDITLGGSSAANYKLAAGQQESTTATISAAELTTVTATPYDAVYDGSAHGISIALSGNAEGATIKYRTTAEGEYDLTENPTYTNAGTVQTVYYQVTKDNYTTVTGSQTVTITQKEVTVSGITASNKTYDGNTTATLVYTGATISGKVESDDLTVTATGTFADANVGTGKNVTISGITLGGASAANYKLAASGNQTSTTANITAVAASVTTAPAAVSGDLTYTGEALTLFTVGSDVTGGTLKYKVTTSSTKPENTDGFKTTIDQQTNAGTYYLWYYVDGDVNHNSTEINATGVSKVISKASATLTCSTAALSFAASDKANATVTKTEVSCSGGTINVRSSNGNYCTVSYSSGTITVKRVSEAAWSATITVSVTPDGNHTAPSNVQFTVSGAYDSGIAASSVTSSHIGYVLAANGKIYKNVAAATSANTTAVAMIAYVGNASNCSHGLAIALEDVSSNYLTWDNSGSNNGGKTAAEFVTNWGSSHSVSGGTCRLPSVDDWKYMFRGCGGATYSSSTTAGSDYSYGRFRDKLKALNTSYDVQSAYYWSSTERSSGDSTAWSYGFIYSLFYNYDKTTSKYVRACYAF